MDIERYLKEQTKILRAVRCCGYEVRKVPRQLAWRANTLKSESVILYDQREGWRVRGGGPELIELREIIRTTLMRLKK